MHTDFVKRTNEEDKAMIENSALTLQREALINELRNVDDINVIQKVQRSLNRALAAVKKAAYKAQEEEEEYISKEEIMDSLRESLTEMYIAQQNGTKLKTLQEVIDEL